MTNQQEEQSTRISYDGITMTKKYVEDEFKLPVMHYEFESEREDTIRIRIRELTPMGFTFRNIGIHPDYGGQYWDPALVDVTYEREMEPQSSHVTVFAMRDFDEDVIDDMLEPPYEWEVTPIDESE